jgi:hypothetical protein
MSSTYNDLYVPGYGSWGYTLDDQVTGIGVNGQSVPKATSTTVTLPNTDQVKITWDDGQNGIVIQIQQSGG